MLKLAQRVAARAAFEEALGSWQPPMPEWVFGLTASFPEEKVALSGPPTALEDQILFQDAKQSVALFLPKFLQMLGSKYHDKYHMNATSRGNRMHYYFATHHPLETFVVDLNVRGGRVLMAVHFIPHDVKGKPNLAGSVNETAKIDSAELSGLTFMRLARKLLSRV